MAIGGTDQESHLAHAVVAPCLQLRRQRLRSQIAPGLVQHHRAASIALGPWRGLADFGDGQFTAHPQPIAFDQIGLR